MSLEELRAASLLQHQLVAARDDDEEIEDDEEFEDDDDFDDDDDDDFDDE